MGWGGGGGGGGRGRLICLKLFCPSSEKESSLKGKNLLPFFPFRVDPFSEGSWCVGKQRGSHKIFLTCTKW